MPAVLRPGWRLPPAPVLRDGVTRARAVYRVRGDGIALYWEGIESTPDIAWPFVTEGATVSDVLALGFVPATPS